MTKRKRAANLDLLRIVSMLLIILLHSIDHSGVLEQAEFSPGPIRFYVWFTYAMTQVCVNLYVMLSGYFLVNASFRIQKLVSLWLESVFYGFGLKLVFMLTGQEPFSAASLLSCFFPITTGRYWFLTIYVGLYLISPFLNHLVRTMDERQHACLNICLFVLFSLWNSIHPAIAGMNSGGGWGLTWFVVLYLLAAWLRLYYRPSNKPMLWIAMYFLIPFCMAVLKCLYRGDIIVSIVLPVVTNWFKYDSAPVYLMSVCLFVAFLNIQIPSSRASRWISATAPLTFGVYLIHAQSEVSPWLWGMLALPDQMSTAAFVPIQLGCVLGIFLTCIAVDFLRYKTLGRLERANALDTLCKKATAWGRKITGQLLEK